ncbi:MAG: HDIG domain-containing protein [Bacteroidales bacterium]|jgi:putative nucleotidyltransferase with HDIG domain|nr:HDIG domain-containing protein [Bacteroidales bacterium]MDN5350863.1 cyclic-di-AMP phosphodiesterase PgpH [Bacteroidales bacterium]
MIKRWISFLRHNYYEIMKILIFMIAVVLIVWQIPRDGKFQFDFQKGKPWQKESLFAPFDFAIYKPEKLLKQEQEELLKSVYPYFVRKKDVTEAARMDLLEQLDYLFSAVETQDSLKASDKELLLQIFDSIQQKGILAYHPVLENLNAQDKLNIVSDKVVNVGELHEFYTLKSAYDSALVYLSKHGKYLEQNFSEKLGKAFVQNVFYDEEMTQKERKSVLDAISLTRGIIQKDELIISEGELVNDENYNVLSSLQKAYELRIGTRSEQNALLMGQIILVLAVMMALFFFLKIIRPDVFDQLKKINMILLLMLLILMPSFFILDKQPALIYLMPFGLLPIILITFFDTRITMMVHLLTIILLGLVVPNPFMFLLLQLIIGFVVIFGLVNHNKRIYYFRTSVMILVGYLFVYTGFTLIQEGNLSAVDWQQIGAFTLSALFTMLALPLIYMLERIFGIITDLTLLELSNTNTPILRQLAQKAPGTFQHSMQVANLSEEALYEIGGDTLLARTGALYHDIGKMDNPVYFIENQMGGYNPHDDISFAESAHIIIDHVRIGIEKARKAKLPEQIIDFIRTHHGNRRVEYFYFMEQRQNPGLTLDERDFSYHGPIPFSKETAVVMMADSVEAASRSIKNPTEQKINDLIENIINKQMETNQFVNANITLKEINTVKKVLKKKLMNIYHVRIAYPD